MGLFSGTPTPSLVSQQHQHLTVATGNRNAPLDSVADVKLVIVDFVSKQPAEVYLIDGTKGASDSIIIGNGETRSVPADFVTLFKAMQLLEYFCSLPQLVESTHFECRKIK